MKEIIEIYISGVCHCNKQGCNSGGSGIVVIMPDATLEHAQGYINTTTARAELRAAATALKNIPTGSKVLVHAGQDFIAKAFNLGWIKNWQEGSWRKGNKKPVQNKDLWLELLAAMQGREVHWEWLAAHSGNPMGERAASLAQLGARSDSLVPDIQ